MYQVLFNTLLYFQRCAPDKLFIAKIKKGSKSVNTGDTLAVLAFCTFSDGPLSIHQVSFNYLLYFKRYALDKFFISKYRKGSNSVKTFDRVMFLALCYSPYIPLSVYQSSFNPHVYFQRYAQDKLFIAKIKN